ncbi:hypothetical protein KUCAC02_037270 [Chaenocephalus aceratus]|nr:hypothetical protein KUCAC02_037270 [Chaenocephalus aceratus]
MKWSRGFLEKAEGRQLACDEANTVMQELTGWTTTLGPDAAFCELLVRPSETPPRKARIDRLEFNFKWRDQGNLYQQETLGED